MRIALVTTEYVTEVNFDGGLSNYTYRTALSLAGLGHEPVVVVASDKREVIRHSGIEVHRVPVVWYHPVLRHVCKYVPCFDLVMMSRALNAEVADIHAGSPVDLVQYTSLGGTAFFRDGSIPSVARLSSYQKLCDAAYDVRPDLKTKLRQMLEVASLRKVDAVFGPSRLIGSEVAKDTGLTVDLIESPFVLDDCALSYDTYEEVKKKLEGREYLLFFGSLGLLKGGKAIGDMIYDLLSRNPQLSFLLVGKDLGYGGAPMFGYIAEKAKEHANRLQHLESIPHSRLYPLVEKSLCVVLPSRVDNFPNTCIEAMAFGKVVVGTRGTSFEQLITDGVSGFLCEKDNPVSLRETIEKVAGLDASQRAEIGMNAYRRTLDLAPERIVKELENLYGRVLERRRVDSRG